MDVGVIGSSLVIMLALYLFFKLTKTGTAMRATAQSQTAARLMGVSVRRIFSLTWAISAAVGGVAGGVVAPLLHLRPPPRVLRGETFPGALPGGVGRNPGARRGGGVVRGLWDTP